MLSCMCACRQHGICVLRYIYNRNESRPYLNNTDRWGYTFPGHTDTTKANKQSKKQESWYYNTSAIPKHVYSYSGTTPSVYRVCIHIHVSSYLSRMLRHPCMSSHFYWYNVCVVTSCPHKKGVHLHKCNTVLKKWASEYVYTNTNPVG